MTYALTLIAVCAAGFAILSLLRLDTGTRGVDLPLAWFVGQGWFGLAALVSRFLVGLPFSRGAILAMTVAPVLAWLAAKRRRVPSPPGSGEPGRWRPRPIWLWAPAAVYVGVIVAATIAHGFNTPTNTDDAVRVRAFTPMLALDDAWVPKARGLLVMAGAVPTFVPAIAWVVTGTLDHFHVNYVVLTDFVALVVLALALGSSRGSPERGWGTALALTSIPLFVYHCTTTYQDAVLATFAGAAFLFAMEWNRTRGGADLARALVVLAATAMVKREGEVVAGSMIAVLAAFAGWDRWRGERVPLRLPALVVGVPLVAALAAKIVAVGSAAAFPLAAILATRAQGEGIGVGGGAPTAALYAAAWRGFADALFRSGNAGGTYWILFAIVALRARTLRQRWLGGSLVVVVVLLVEAAVSSVWMIPEFTVNQTTVHRALIVVTVPAAIWIAAALVEAASPSADGRAVG